MEQVLILSSSQKAADALTELFAGQQVNIQIADSVEQATSLMAMTEFAVVIVNTPLTEENPFAFAARVSETCGVLLLAPAKDVDTISQKLVPHGVFTLQKPIVRTMFRQACQMALASQKRSARLREENRKLQEKIEEVKLVDRAKYVLIENLHMTESQAHRFIEKQAMDLRRTKREVALEVLKTYEY